jgi:hypothetical protein
MSRRKPNPQPREVYPGNNKPSGSWFEVVGSLIQGRRFWFLVATIAAVFLLSVHLLRSGVITFEMGAGKVTINKIDASAGKIATQTGSTQQAAVMVGAAGGREEGKIPWIGTGIQVKKGDTVTIEASGSVHTALRRLIKIAETNRIPNPEQYQSWVSPNGQDNFNDCDSLQSSKRLVPNSPYGALVAGIWNDNNQVLDETKEKIGAKRDNLTIKADGELVLAVNDILLDKDSKDVYALKPDQCSKYYVSRLKESEGERYNNLSEAERQTIYQNMYEERKKAWDEISGNEKWTIWYDDNIGAFSVSIVVNPSKSA